MPKTKERKLRRKVRQQIRWAVEDPILWDSDIFVEDRFTFTPLLEDHDEPIRPRHKVKIDKPQHRNIELVG